MSQGHAIDIGQSVLSSTWLLELARKRASRHKNEHLNVSFIACCISSVSITRMLPLIRKRAAASTLVSSGPGRGAAYQKGCPVSWLMPSSQAKNQSNRVVVPY